MAYEFTTSEPQASDSPWDDDDGVLAHTAQDSEWTKLSTNFTNAGYREGITAGKEGALQEGFDTGFALVGAPLGRELGLLRGLASALLSHLDFLPVGTVADSQREEARALVNALAPVRFSDIAPRDLEAEQHAKEHLAADGDDDDDAMDENEELAEKRRTEQLEDMMRRLDAGSGREGESRMGVEGVREVRARLEALCVAVGVDARPIWI
ncbi:hypothetical protein BV25DRAFT_1884607 [Artomyces pyxidatus]|uniref:Uncharacterized protein n=1 Tax=Artomyces pyxidatus TaxID=48021 RepID=A0ACB8T3Y2_9AGAM|nr:hypothetical protein BV25DRAFT_1884607 [Artomyces pyxidatus]